MAKKLGKREKLDLILSELSALRSDIKKLLTQRSPGADLDPQGRPRLLRPLRAKKTEKRSSAPRKRAKAKPKPVLVEPEEGEPSVQLASRIA
jgi:hypothetical protein